MNEQSTGWDQRLLENFLWPFDAEVVRGIKIPFGRHEDVLAWHYEKSGQFTVRSAYKLAMQLANAESESASSAHPLGTRPIWKSIWKLPVPQKVKLFVWKVAVQGLLTKAAKKQRKLEKENICDICGQQPETDFHALIECSIAKKLWEAMEQHWEIPKRNELKIMGPEWLLQLLAGLDTHRAGLTTFVCWRAWYVRNELIHNK
jgi:hypothetical protein